jgi:hypothetical protein
MPTELVDEDLGPQDEFAFARPTNCLTDVTFHHVHELRVLYTGAR